jgi:hypothetical protein
VNPYGNTVQRLPELMLAWEDKDATKYLTDPIPPKGHGRGILQEDAPAIFFDPGEKRLYFRIASPSQDLERSWHTRGITPTDKWRVFSHTDKKHYLYGEPIGRRVVLVEGIFDAIRIGLGAISLMGTDMSPVQFAYLQTFGEILFWLDPDPAGHKARDEMLARFTRYGTNASVFGTDQTPEPGDLVRNAPEIHTVREWLRR